MRIETIGETVKVRADFSTGRIVPVMFKWNGRTYRIRKINTRWTDNQNQQPVHYFSVEAEADSYELSFNAVDALWRLERVMVE